MSEGAGGGRSFVWSFVGLFLSCVCVTCFSFTFESALQLLIHRYGSIRFAEVPERVPTKEFRRFDYSKLEVASLRRTGHL